MSQSSPTKSQTAVQIPRTPNALSVQDPDLRSQLNAQLLKDGHIERPFPRLTVPPESHNHLAHILASDPSNWPTRIRQHALALLRSPDATCTTFPKLMARVLADVRDDTAAARREDERRMRAAEMGDQYRGIKDRRDHRGERMGGSLEVPAIVMDEGVRLTRECLETVVEVDP